MNLCNICIHARYDWGIILPPHSGHELHTVPACFQTAYDPDNNATRVKIAAKTVKFNIFLCSLSILLHSHLVPGYCSSPAFETGIRFLPAWQDHRYKTLPFLIQQN